MAVFTRPDSPYYQLYLETTKQKEATKILIGTTAAQRRDSRALAEDLYHQRMNQLAGRLYKLQTATPAIRFRLYAETYERDVIALRKGERRERELLKQLVAILGDDLVSAIDQDRTRTYMQRRRADGVSAATINREVDLLKGMLRDAAPKYLSVSPLVGLKRLPAITPRRRLLTLAEERRLLKVGDVEDRALLILGLDTLIRLGDLLDLEQQDRAGRWLYVKDPKGGAPYEVALSARAAKAMDRLKGSRYLFPTFRQAANPRDWPSAVRKRFQRLCKAAHVPYGKKDGGLTWHWATRRTGATRMLVQHQMPIPIVQKQGNWKTPDVLLAIYAEANRGDQQKAMAAFPSGARKRRKSA